MKLTTSIYNYCIQLYNWMLPSESFEIEEGLWIGDDDYGKITICKHKNGTYSGKLENNSILLKELQFVQIWNCYKGIIYPPNNNIDIPILLTCINKNKLKIEANNYYLPKPIFLHKA